MPTDTTQKIYRAGVGLVLLNASNRIFLGERIDTPGAWQMPQGGIDHGETVEQAVFRELHEEIGTDKATIIAAHPDPIRYDLPPALRRTLWNGVYAGQEQRWVALRFAGTDADINLRAHIPPEFSHWQWSPPEKILDLIVPFKRDTYRTVLAWLRMLEV